MSITFDYLKKKYPTFSDDAIRKAVALLNRKPASVREIWAGEDQRGARPQAIGDDGLTNRQREMNEFAEENALPLPFSEWELGNRTER